MAKVDKKIKNLDPADIERIIRMGWEDRTSFEAIQVQFGLTPNETIKVMRKFLSRSAFERWRKRTFEQGHLKHEKKRDKKELRFKSTRQRQDGSTKGWK